MNCVAIFQVSVRNSLPHIGLALKATSWQRKGRMALHLQSMKAPPTSAGRRKTLTPHLIITLCDQLSPNLYMRLDDMVTFIGEEFKVVITRYSIHRAFKDIK